MSTGHIRSASLLLGVFVACHAPTDPQSSALSVVLTAESTALGVGDSTVLAMDVRNVTAKRVTYDVPAGNGAFDVTIERAAGGEVWRRSSQPSSIPAATLTISPGGSASFQWRLRVGGLGGVNLPPGAYKIRGLFIDSRRGVIATAIPVLDVAVYGSS